MDLLFVDYSKYCSEYRIHDSHSGNCMVLLEKIGVEEVGKLEHEREYEHQ